jgi:hypothetical protein
MAAFLGERDVRHHLVLWYLVMSFEMAWSTTLVSLKLSTISEKYKYRCWIADTNAFPTGADAASRLVSPAVVPFRHLSEPGGR